MSSHQTHNTHVKWPIHSNRSVSENFYDLPAFEDAFDTYSLKKFYREQESINSESTGLSPQQESSFFEDYQFLDGKDNEKPWGNSLSSRARHEFTSLNTESLFPLDLDLSDKVLQMPCRRTQSYIDQPTFTVDFASQSRAKPTQNFHISLTNQSLRVSKPPQGVQEENHHTSPGKFHIPFKFDDLFIQPQPSQVQPFEGEKVHNGAQKTQKRGKKIFKIIRDAPRTSKLTMSPKKKSPSAVNYQTIPQPSFCSPSLSERSSATDANKKKVMFNFNLSSTNSQVPNYFSSGNEQMKTQQFNFKTSAGGNYNTAMPYHFTQE